MIAGLAFFVLLYIVVFFKAVSGFCVFVWRCMVFVSKAFAIFRGFFFILNNAYLATSASPLNYSPPPPNSPPLPKLLFSSFLIFKSHQSSYSFFFSFLQIILYHCFLMLTWLKNVSSLTRKIWSFMFFLLCYIGFLVIRRIVGFFHGCQFFEKNVIIRF